VPGFRLDEVKVPLDAAAGLIADPSIAQGLVYLPALRLDDLELRLIGETRPVGLLLGF
jgi:hypothetical protein